MNPYESLTSLHHSVEEVRLFARLARRFFSRCRGELLGSDDESSHPHLGSASALGTLEIGTFAQSSFLGSDG